MSNFENRFRKYIVPNLTMWLILGYAIGYIIEMLDQTGKFIYFLALDPYKILHGEIWRLVTWVIIPPSESNILFVILMLWCCYSIGTILERTWGTYKYNLFIFTGIFLTILSAFAYFFVLLVLGGADYMEAYEKYLSITISNGTVSDAYKILAYMMESNVGNLAAFASRNIYIWNFFSTYYINISIYLAFAMTYPNDTVRLYFLIPIKMKWLGIVDIIYMGYILIVGTTGMKFAVLAAIINCLIFYIANIKGIAISPKQIKRHNQFNRSYRAGQNSGYKQHGFQAGGQTQKMARHKCAICGKTDLTDPDMTFRYCSKCNGNYEYCQVHLFQHTHVR